MFEENTSVETQEVAEPVESNVSEESQEVAEPETHKTSADAAFAEMRRRAEAAERKVAEAEANEKARQEAIKQLTGKENGLENALAETYGLDLDDVVATLEAHTESAKKDLKIEELEEELVTFQATKQMEDDLRTIQAIDPSIKSLSDLGETFLNLTTAGVDAETAYYASKGKQIVESKTPPEPIGKVGKTTPEKEFFTEAEVDAMSEAEQRRNYEKIMKSMTKW